MATLESFLSTIADDLFSSVASFEDAAELDTLDVEGGQQNARCAIRTAIANAARYAKKQHLRLALVKGEAGSGKTHVLTTVFKRAAASGEVYPAVLQLTAPVRPDNYDVWLIDALVGQMTARHFANERNESPMRRLAERLLGRLGVEQQDEFRSLIDDPDDDGEIALAKKFAEKIRKEAQNLLVDDPPGPPFLAAILLAGFGDFSAINYLRQGVIDTRLSSLGLDEIKTSHRRMMVLKNLGLTAQIVGACLAIGLDQVENTVRLGSEELFVHALTQAVRIAEAVPNCTVIIVSIADEYDRIVSAQGSVRGLPASDRERIEHDPPAARLEPGDSAFRRAIIAQRLAVLGKRAKLAEIPAELEPLPAWMVSRIDGARNVRAALRDVGLFRAKALALGRLPSQVEYEGSGQDVEASSTVDESDFDKLWADFLDVAPSVRNKLLTSTKAELLAWWVREASLEHIAGDGAAVGLASLEDAHKTPVIDIVLKMKGVPLERRQLALCEAPNRNSQLAAQIERFLESLTGVPAVLRTNGFPKGRQTQVAGSLRKVDALCGLKLDLGETEWHVLQRAKDFSDQHARVAGFLAWRRERQWLSQLFTPLQPLIAFPPELPSDAVNATQEVDLSLAPSEISEAQESRVNGNANRKTKDNAPFPVYLGAGRDGCDVIWDPYRESPNHLNNFSVLITGDAGSGKTQTIRILIDAVCREALSLTIFDFKADYCDPTFADPLGIEVVDVRASGLPFNPLRPPPRGASGVQPIEHAYEVSGVLARVFRLGAIQQGLLREGIVSAYEDSDIRARDWVDPSNVVWPSFDQVLDRLREEPRAASILTKLSLFSELGLLPAHSSDEQSFESFVNKRICLKLNDLPNDEVKSALAEIIIIQLHGYALRGAQPRKLKRLMVFDEAHRVRGSQRLEALAREGRAFGVGIVIGTQFPGDIPDEMAGNLATQLFLMNNQADHRSFVVRQVHGTTSGAEPREMLKTLGNLKPFQGFFTNAHHKGVLIDILPHHAR